jgi:hypothetical protein
MLVIIYKINEGSHIETFEDVVAVVNVALIA